MDDLSEKILNYLKNKKSEATVKLVHALRVQKKSLNNTLYKLERQSLIVKVQDTPPAWALTENCPGSNSSAVGRTTRKRKAPGRTADMGGSDGQDGSTRGLGESDGEDAEISRKVISFLEGKKAAKSYEIAKAVGVTRPAANKVLYTLQNKGLITKDNGRSLTWSLVKQLDATTTLGTDLNTSHYTSGPPLVKTEANISSQPLSSSGGSFPVSSGGDFPVFQDTQLFRTDISLDMDETELLSGLSGGDPDDIDLDLNERLSGGYNGQTMKQEADLVDELTSQSPETNVKDEVMEDFNIDNEGVYKDELFGNQEEMTQCDTDAEMKDIDKDQEIIDQVCESGDVTNDRLLDNSDNSEYVGNAADSPDQSVEDTGQTDIQPGAQHFSVFKNEDRLESDQIGLASHDTAELVNCEVDMNKVKDGAMNEDSVEMDDVDDRSKPALLTDMDTSKPGVSASLTDMQDCDAVLEVLSTLPGMAGFVLANRTKLGSEKMEAALDRCQQLGFVSGSSKLWRITPEGIDYITNKTGGETDKQTPVQSVVQPTQAAQVRRFTGPPPSPMALLKSKAGSSAGVGQTPSTQVRDQSHVNRVTLQNSASNSQFGASSVRNNVAINSLSSSQGSRMNTTYKPTLSMTSSLHNKDNVGTINSVSTNQGISRNMANTSSLFTTNSHHDKHRDMDVSSSLVNSGLWDEKSQDIKSPPKNLYQNQTRPNVSNAPTTKSEFKQPSSVSQQQSTNQTVIPSKYASYPNKLTSDQFFKNMNSRSRNSVTNTDNRSSSTKSVIPPSPMEILSKNLKKTEISPPNTPVSTPNSKNPMAVTYNQTVQNPPSLLRSLPGNQSSLAQPKSLFSGQFGTQPMSLQVNQNQSRTSQPINTDFTSLPVNVNKTSSNGKSALNSLALSNESFNALNKNAVSALMEYAQLRKMQARVQVIGQRGPPHRPTFTMAAFVGNRQFSPVTCTNKKDGRKEACDIAMRQLVAEGQFQAETAAAETSSSGAKPAAPLETMTHFDKIAALTHRGFTALVSQITAESFAGRKVIAGLVMKRYEGDVGVLISLGTGNRCITGQQLSLQGNTVNDSHAEIITRRGFIRFLYKQLLDYDSTKNNPLFEKSRTGKLQIKPKISFHLYISTAPCGDGALFSPRDAESSKTPVDSRIRPPHEPVFSSNVQGLLRTKVEGGEGTIPIEPGFKCQTFDGIQRGERLRTMSCTDKVCRWNVVGMQGALLSHFIEPVYLDSLTLGLLYDHGHLSRAVCCRVGRGPTNIDESLPTNYRLNHPWLGRVTTCDPPREVQKTKAVSVNWSFGDKSAEVTDGTLGLCNTSIEKSMFSRCSKRNMYNSFKAVCEKFGRRDLLQAENYKDAKMMASDFQQAREAMLRKFKENKFGPWVSKPVEEEMFTWEEN